MGHEPLLDTASALIDLVMRSTALAVRDRVVLETGLAAVNSDAGALWRLESGGVWRPSVERGRRGGRFETERATRRALESPVVSNVPGCGLVRAHIAGTGAALVLNGTIDEEIEDGLEALLMCLLLAELADGGSSGPAAPLPARIPAGEPGRIEHDVRNALTSLMATRQVLERFGAELPHAERVAFDEAVQRECERTGSLVARGILGRTPEVELTGTSDLVTSDVVALERAGVLSAGSRLDLSIQEPARGLSAACGSEAWSRIVRNLVRNALEAATARGRGSKIVVRLEAEGDLLVLRVEDDAGGLPDSAFPTLFEEGFSAGKPEGSGQGLAVVRSLALASGGGVHVRRRVGGALFEVWMPIAVHAAGLAQTRTSDLEKNVLPGLHPLDRPCKDPPVDGESRSR